MHFDPFRKLISKWLSPLVRDAIQKHEGAEKMIHTAMSFANDSQVEGDYLEFGVFRGRAFARAFHAAQMYQRLDVMRFFAFDSFQGLPAITAIDDGAACRYKRGDYACDLAQFRKNLTAGAVDLRKVEAVAGWFNEVLNEETKSRLPIKKAAVVWIDCDLYESTP